MKVTYIGGGSFSLVPQIRDLLQWDELPAKLEISLYDRSLERAKAVEAYVKQCPELQKVTGVTIHCAETLDEALQGADFVAVIVCPWNGAMGAQSERLCLEAGFLGSDNVSANGAFLSVRGGPLVLDIARRMEQVAPDGTMIIFTNPIATLAAVVNRATSIRAIGICAGQANHSYDISRMMGWKDIRFDFEAEVVGTNHISWIKALRLDGEDFFPILNARLEKPLDFDAMHPQSMRPHFELMFTKMVEAYRKFDAFLFSTEGDGLPHLMYYQEAVEIGRRELSRPQDQDAAGRRQREVAEFIRLSKETLTEEQWNDPSRRGDDPAVMTANLVIKGLAGTKPVDVTLSYLNNGAIPGFEDDVITEYTMRLQSGQITPQPRHTLPPATVGVTQALIESQTLVADAIIHEDAHRFLQGFYAYPPCRNSRDVDALYAQLLACNKTDIPEWVK
ncbi:MAG: hypothetical protein ACRYFS_11560 [Janthinobacterium lividum]